MQLKKSLRASLEDKKLIYALMGFILVLSICYVAFEWTEEPTVYADEEEVVTEEVDELPPPTTQELPPPPPPPPAEETVQNIDVLVVVEDDVETEVIEIEEKEVEIEIIAATPEVEEEEEEEEEVFMIVENMPEFPGGQQAMMKYIAENIKYPVIAQENGIQGRVICQFVVEKDGSISNIQVVRTSGDASLDKEAVRVIGTMPRWKPGKQRGKPVRVTFTLPVSFRLQ
jgi:protein TonB